MHSVKFDFPGARTIAAQKAFLSIAPDAHALYLPPEPMDCLPNRIGLYGYFGLTPIETHQDGTFAFAEVGIPALVMGVHGPGADEPIDLVAWYPRQPALWWLHRGLAPLLGEYEASKAIYFDEPLVVRSSPESWLFSGLNGCCMLDAYSAPFYLTGAKRVLAETPAVANAIRRAHLETVPAIRLMPKADVGRAA